MRVCCSDAACLKRPLVSLMYFNELTKYRNAGNLFADVCEERIIIQAIVPYRWHWAVGKDAWK